MTLGFGVPKDGLKMKGRVKLSDFYGPVTGKIIENGKYESNILIIFGESPRTSELFSFVFFLSPKCHVLSEH